MKRTFLIPVDGTEEATQAVDWVLRHLYRDQGDELYFLHVVAETQGSFVAGLGGLGGVDSAMMIDTAASPQEQVEAANSMMNERFVEKAVKAGAQHRVELVRFSTDTDSIAQVIVTRASELRATAVVLASHRNSSLRELFVGSVTNAVVSHCQETVIVLH